MLGGRSWDEWIAQYATSHQHPVNRLCHTIGIPLIALSVPLALIAIVVDGLWPVPLAMFVVGWLFQFVGHAFEGKPPEFLHDWRFLFVGLRWWMAKIRGKASVTLLLVGLALSAPRTAMAQAVTGATLADLAFMAGCWRGDFADDQALEETYTSPSANLILGTSRYLWGDQAVRFEFSVITRDSTGISLLPFPGGRPSEHMFRLTSIEPGSATFEAPEHDFPKRIRYTRGDGRPADSADRCRNR